MSEETVIRHCAPTLACIKTGSLFTSAFATKAAMNTSLASLNCRLRGKGLRAVPLRYRDGIGLIYLYRPNRLSADLEDRQAARLLSEFGYCGGHPERCIRRLMARLAESAEFPHEIGLFLGYPPEDVDGFIHRRDEAKCCGTWKVYGDVDAARETFARYRKCTSAYLQRWAQGWSIEQLTVAV